MPFEPVKVEGLAELQRALREVSKGIQANLKTDLLVAAQQPRVLAERLGLERISGLGGSGWNEMRLGTTSAIVYMAPKRKGTRNAARRRPNLGPLLVDKAMEPAITASTGRLNAGAQKAVDRAVKRAGF